MEDRELLELSAKAAGLVVLGRVFDAPYDDYYWRGPEYGLQIEGMDGIWNPLEDDGDALRLAVKLGFSYAFHDCLGIWVKEGETNENHKTDQYAATRRAIVRAAAEIGKAMP